MKKITLLILSCCLLLTGCKGKSIEDDTNNTQEVNNIVLLPPPSAEQETETLVDSVTESKVERVEKVSIEDIEEEKLNTLDTENYIVDSEVDASTNSITEYPEYQNKVFNLSKPYAYSIKVDNDITEVEYICCEASNYFEVKLDDSGTSYIHNNGYNYIKHYFDWVCSEGPIESVMSDSGDSVKEVYTNVYNEFIDKTITCESIDMSQYTIEGVQQYENDNYIYCYYKKPTQQYVFAVDNDGNIKTIGHYNYIDGTTISLYLENELQGNLPETYITNSDMYNDYYSDFIEDYNDFWSRFSEMKRPDISYTIEPYEDKYKIVFDYERAWFGRLEEDLNECGIHEMIKDKYDIDMLIATSGYTGYKQHASMDYISDTNLSEEELKDISDTILRFMCDKSGMGEDYWFTE